MRGPWDAATAPRAAGSCRNRLRRAPRGGRQLLSAEQPARGAGRRVWCAEGAGCGSPAAAGGPGSSAYPSSRLIASPSPAAGTGRQAAGQTCQPAAGSRAPAPRSQEGPGWGCRLGRTRTRPSPVLRGREPPAAAAASPRGATAAARSSTGGSAREKEREGEPWPRGAKARTRSSSCEL